MRSLETNFNLFPSLNNSYISDPVSRRQQVPASLLQPAPLKHGWTGETEKAENQKSCRIIIIIVWPKPFFHSNLIITFTRSSLEIIVLYFWYLFLFPKKVSIWKHEFQQIKPKLLKVMIYTGCPGFQKKSTFLLKAQVRIIYKHAM
jgi:hypothetical protein